MSSVGQSPLKMALNSVHRPVELISNLNRTWRAFWQRIKWRCLSQSLKREQKCLAEAIYFESRSEPEDGQAAVAQVVLNRVKSGLYPTNICGVVYQNRHKYKACQFSFACEGRSLAITEPGPWSTAQRVAREVLEGESYNTAVGASTHYHANYVAPYWSRKLKRTDQIGRHIFYRLRPGQT